MGLILDSSVVIDAERRGDTVVRLIERVAGATGDQDSALSAVGLTELVHGLYRANTPTAASSSESISGRGCSASNFPASKFLVSF